jgi:osmotically-inducible protein OsmY
MPIMPNKLFDLKNIKTASTLAAVLLLSSQMTGCVGLLAAGAVSGTSLALDRRDVGANVDDKQIELQASNLMQEHFKKAHINCEAFNRNVLLTGEVASVADGQAAANLVRRIHKVREVTNELAVGEPSKIGERTRDSVITSKVKSRLIEDRLLHSGAFVVTTERGNVYLQGRVTRAEAERASEIARNVNGVRQVVKVFDYLSDDEFKRLR